MALISLQRHGERQGRSQCQTSAVMLVCAPLATRSKQAPLHPEEMLLLLKQAQDSAMLKRSLFLAYGLSLSLASYLNLFILILLFS